MAHASEIGTYTMAQIIDDISYHRLKQISDWQLLIRPLEVLSCIFDSLILKEAAYAFWIRLQHVH
ncbi:hypothetical protein, partial [Methyloglobulus sp.]|uniref:hypothetical protein n=1 Tax=Methyloglobulus sp. TaxID=2518622 RepID=UPI0032B768C1